MVGGVEHYFFFQIYGMIWNNNPKRLFFFFSEGLKPSTSYSCPKINCRDSGTDGLEVPTIYEAYAREYPIYMMFSCVARNLIQSFGSILLTTLFSLHPNNVISMDDFPAKEQSPNGTVVLLPFSISEAFPSFS